MPGRIKKSGFSLIELLIYAGLMILVMGVVLRMAVLNRRQMERPAASFRLQQEILAAARTLQQDLSETSLSSVRIFPGPGSPAALPGLSFASPRSLEDGSLRLSPSGAPLWQKIVYYSLEKDPRRPGEWHLLRKEGKISGLPSATPIASPYEPASAPCDRRRTRVSARFILPPGAFIAPLSKTLGPAGGFEVYFSNASGERSLTDFRRLHLICVHLWAGETSQTTGKFSALEHLLEIVPRN